MKSPDMEYSNNRIQKPKGTHTIKHFHVSEKRDSMNQRHQHIYNYATGFPEPPHGALERNL